MTNVASCFISVSLVRSLPSRSLKTTIYLYNPWSGGGPTGVEFAAELHDLLHTDIKQHYPGLASLAKISLFDVAPNILGSFDAGLQQ